MGRNRRSKVDAEPCKIDESRSSFIGQVFDGKWKVIGCKYVKSTDHAYFTFENIYNGQTVTISDGSFRRLRMGQTSISHIMSERIVLEKQGFKLAKWQQTKSKQN